MMRRVRRYGVPFLKRMLWRSCHCQKQYQRFALSFNQQSSRLRWLVLHPTLNILRSNCSDKAYIASVLVSLSHLPRARHLANAKGAMRGG